MREEERSNLGLWVLRAAMLLGFCTLALQLWRLQVLGVQGYRVAADANRFRLVSVEAPRGAVYERNGLVLARNVPRYSVCIIPGSLPPDPAARWDVLNRLAAWLQSPIVSDSSTAASEWTAERIESIVDQNGGPPSQAVTIKANVDKQLAFVLEEDHLLLPGVILEVESRREYPLGSLLSHVVGFLGPIPVDQVQTYLTKPESDYVISDKVGLMGVEASYEDELRGQKGQKHIEMDAFQREIQVLAIDPPTPGHSLVLSIDGELQRASESALFNAMRLVDSTAGVVVAMDPRSGEVLAMVSLPSYDNNLFATGISSQDYARLLENPDRPLVNHSISGQFPPGSIYKVVPAAAALEEHIVDRTTRIRCQGHILLPNKFFPDNLSLAQKFVCWTPYGHGSLSIIGGIANSCDIFFYHVGGGFEDFEGLGVERLAEYSEAFGLGQLSRIDLVGETRGLVPDEQWKRINYGEPWVTGDTYNASIGQGYVLVTPLQMVNAMAALANGGTLYRPQVVYQVVDEQGYTVRDFSPQELGKLPVSQDNINIVREGLRYTITDGTGHRANLVEIAVAGKTGTAEYFGPLDAQGNLPTHAWFTAFAPYEDPEIALVIFVSGGHEGARIAVPVAAQILRAYFGIPQPADEQIVGPPPGD